MTINHERQIVKNENKKNEKAIGEPLSPPGGNLWAASHELSNCFMIFFDQRGLHNISSKSVGVYFSTV